jgi:hypothetical protein
MKILIGIPTHSGEVRSITAMNLLRASATRRYHLDFKFLGLSLLAKNFNMLFAEAFNGGYDYFVLHHADLAARGWNDECWLDVLVDQLRQHSLHALSAVSPIKSPTGVTSTAIERVPGNHFSLRRMTVRELLTWYYNCPNRMIDSESLASFMGLTNAGPLLINTGLLIMDLQGPWFEHRWPGFCIDDKLIWNSAGTPKSYTIPEDWCFSRWMHDNGVRYATTPSLVVEHEGGHFYKAPDSIGVNTDPSEIDLTPEQYEQT